MNGVSQAGGVYHRQFYNNQDDTVEAKHNYWGAGMTTNATIDPGIYDNEEGKGEVTFYEFRTGPIPELSTVILCSAWDW